MLNLRIIKVFLRINVIIGQFAVLLLGTTGTSVFSDLKMNINKNIN